MYEGSAKQHKTSGGCCTKAQAIVNREALDLRYLDSLMVRAYFEAEDWTRSMTHLEQSSSDGNVSSARRVDNALKMPALRITDCHHTTVVSP